MLGLNATVAKAKPRGPGRLTEPLHPNEAILNPGAMLFSCNYTTSLLDTYRLNPQHQIRRLCALRGKYAKAPGESFWELHRRLADRYEVGFS